MILTQNELNFFINVKSAEFYDTSIDYILFLTNEKEAYKKD